MLLYVIGSRLIPYGRPKGKSPMCALYLYVLVLYGYIIRAYCFNINYYLRYRVVGRVLLPIVFR